MDKLNQTYAYYLAEFKSVEKRREELKEILSALEKAGATTLSSAEQENPAVVKGELTKAVIWVLEQHQAISASGVKNVLIKAGYPKVGKNFLISVHKTLRRLVAQDRVLLLKQENTTVYTLNLQNQNLAPVVLSNGGVSAPP
ncbi:MAG TPA: hypothetical protein VKC60_05680 [Opitutaceae bacterium]|nr:hypothetical protein [Opitutaceae bacterium]